MANPARAADSKANRALEVNHRDRDRDLGDRVVVSPRWDSGGLTSVEDLELGEGGVVGDGRSDHAAYGGLCCNIFNHIASDDSSDTAVFLEIKAVSLIPESLPEKRRSVQCTP